jgi:PPM family protein phosphatase
VPYRDIVNRGLAVQHAGCSIVGRNRSVNEDGWASLPSAGVFFVADGCGGEASGRVAADLALGSLEGVLLRGSVGGVEPLAAAVDEANVAIRAAAIGKQRGMGAAIAALRLASPWAVTAHVGDCRIYRYRRSDTHGGVLVRMTTDDSLWVHMVRAGASFDEVKEAYETHGNVITQALGTGPNIQTHVEYQALEPGDLYLLCSDGVTRQLDDESIRNLISDDDLPLAERCEKLVRAADERLGTDNVTAILVQC